MKEQSGREGESFARKIVPLAIMLAAILLALALPVLSWFSTGRGLNAYAPITSPEALYIGAGHRDISNGTFEDIRYMYINGINAKEDYSDYVFCVYGAAVSGFHLQLGFTTNNQFIYEVYYADESSSPSEGAVKYTTHADDPEDCKTYYYSIDDTLNPTDPESGEFIPLAGGFLNLDDDEFDESGLMLAESSRHALDYGEYTNVDRYADALYWQTTTPVSGNAIEDFVVYFILRIKTNGKESNDRETDVLCISAKSTTVIPD